MPAYGKNQAPAGVNKTKPGKNCGTRTMVSKNTNIRSTLSISGVEYKGNAVLNANRS